MELRVWRHGHQWGRGLILVPGIVDQELPVIVVWDSRDTVAKLL